MFNRTEAKDKRKWNSSTNYQLYFRITHDSFTSIWMGERWKAHPQYARRTTTMGYAIHRVSYIFSSLCSSIRISTTPIYSSQLSGYNLTFILLIFSCSFLIHHSTFAFLISLPPCVRREITQLQFIPIRGLFSFCSSPLLLKLLNILAARTASDAGRMEGLSFGDNSMTWHQLSLLWRQDTSFLCSLHENPEQIVKL